jgi:Coenzyme PQQ synthesis protein D (PqqD)
MIGTTSRPRRHDLVLARPGENALILLNPRSGHYFTLDEIGGRVWTLCDGTHSVAEMAAIIGEEYEAPAAEIEADVRELLTDLASESLVLEAG